MLGVFKRRWKPKRSANVSRIPDSNNPLDTPDKRPHHQVHPVCEEKKAHLLGYATQMDAPTNDFVNEGSPPPYPKRASLESNPSPTQYYPLAPNICVEAGRIQFVRQESAPEGCVAPPTPPATPRGRVTVTRGQQTDCDSFDPVKKSLEERIQELEISLEAVHKNELHDKQTIAKLQKQIARRESAQRDADRERRLRTDSESRAKQALQDAARCRSRLKLLTTEFARMEETVRSMLAYKKQAEQLRQEKNALTLAFENRCQQYQSTIVRLNSEVSSLRQQLAQLGSDFGSPEEILHAHASALQRQAEESRKQYERCLDDVANQVVRALLAQKGLREEVGSLNLRIHELESQNRALTSMLVHQLRGSSEPEAEIISPGQNSQIVKHNSFNSEAFDSPMEGGNVIDRLERRLSANSDILETRLSLEDKKRHQVLTKLWTQLKGSEVTPKKLLEALSSVDSTLWVQPQRPVSLNLHLPIVQATKYRRTRPILAQSCTKSEEETTGNESPESSGNRDEGYSTMSSDVQTDQTREPHPPNALEDLKEATDETESNLITTEHSTPPDIFYIPFNILDNFKRNSFPPGKAMLPFQHIMRSFSDSHLCIKITTAPSPCSYTFTSPISSSPSILLLDLTSNSHSSEYAFRAANQEKMGLRRARASSALWSDDFSSDEHIQHWLRLDETRSAFELEYDRAELEDWSLSLSTEDLQFKALTPGQISIQTLPSIQENNPLELEEDANECLWNNSSYMMDKEGRELITLLMDQNLQGEWPYALASSSLVSPDNSWSSGASDPETQSKRSSANLSDDANELPGTDFTRDFYRLVKFESTKSLASTSSRSLGGENEHQLHNVLNFLAEQQKKEAATSIVPKNENYVNLKQLCEEFTMNEQNTKAQEIAFADEVCLVTAIENVESENCSSMAERPVDICSSISVELTDSTIGHNDDQLAKSDVSTSLNDSTLTSSSVSTPETIVSKIPRRKNLSNKMTAAATGKKSLNSTEESKIPKINSSCSSNNNSLNNSRIPHKRAGQKQKIVEVKPNHNHHVITSERLPQCTAGLISNIIDGPPHRAVSFHERATSKDVIDELNRMIKNENGGGGVVLEAGGNEGRLDQGCRTTGWVHVEREIDLADPKARANLLDVMMASVSSDSSPTSSCGGSVASDSTEDPPDYGQLHRIHRFHRQKKAKAARPELAVVRASVGVTRPTIIGRPDFFVRYGEKEMEAVASFDFLDELGGPIEEGEEVLTQGAHLKVTQV